MKLYKLTDAYGRTHGQTQWRIGETVSAADGAPMLCTKTVIHAYVDPYLALLMNPIHANFSRPRLYEAEGEVVVNDSTKVGVKSLTLTKRLRLPRITTEQRISFAINCALAVYKKPRFVKWANAWLDGKDRSAAAAAVAYAYVAVGHTYAGYAADAAAVAGYAADAAAAAGYAADAADAAGYAASVVLTAVRKVFGQ